MFELDGVSVLKHNSIKIKKDKVIYIDPFQIDIPAHDADLILCTHSHYDHFSPDDIKAVPIFAAAPGRSPLPPRGTAAQQSCPPPCP